MQPRFVIVPAIPIEGASFHIGSRFYSKTTSGGFDIYDNQEKERLKHGFAERSDASSACDKMNYESRNPDEQFPILRSE
ncbi:hypothetical protein ACQKO7_12675 [Pseudomonas putida]|uniref:hypothetical protein n=1 Tax=Pseudomonas putida TaxID=303 RepID=UPI003D066683